MAFQIILYITWYFECPSEEHQKNNREKNLNYAFIFHTIHLDPAEIY